MAQAERHYLRCDGSDFWGYVTSTRLKTAGGTPEALIAVVTDITDRKAQQLALLEETARWQMMMERSRDGIVILDAARKAVRDVNPAFAEMLGYSRSEMPGMHPWDWDLRFTREEIEAMSAESCGRRYLFRDEDAPQGWYDPRRGGEFHPYGVQRGTPILLYLPRYDRA